MNKEVLDEREFELINIIGPKIGANQRDLSRQMKVSLGMVNMLIRRLISKGFIRIKQLNKKKVEYILTPNGFAEKMRKSVKYTMKTVHSISFIRQHLTKIVESLRDEKQNSFVILGDSDLSVLLEIAFKENFGREYSLEKIKEMPLFGIVDGKLLICKEGFENGKKPVGAINIIEELANSGMFDSKNKDI